MVPTGLGLTCARVVWIDACFPCYIFTPCPDAARPVTDSESEDGCADLSHVLAVAKSIGEVIDYPIVVVDKSTVPVGTADMVRECISQGLDRRGKEVDFEVVSNIVFHFSNTVEFQRIF